MPRVFNPNAVENSLPGIVKQQKITIADLAGAAMQTFFSFVVGAGGMIVNGATQLVGGVTGGLAVTGGLGVTGAITSTTTVTASSSIYTAGTVQADAGVTSVGVYGLDVSLLPGARRTNWTNVNGQIGYAPSSITKKNLVGDVTIGATDFLACAPVVFEYLGQLDIRDNPDNPHHDPDYLVPQEVGFIAETLDEHGLGAFVFRNEDGTPAGINYAEFAAVGFVTVGRDHEKRLAEVERMLSRLDVSSAA